MERTGLLIGEVARRSGASRKAVRLYEARGILPAARRTASGYPVYSSEVIGILEFVEQGRRLGLTLAEIRDIVVLRRAGVPPCAHVHRLLEQRAADLAGLLAAVRRILRSWASENGEPAAGCPHFERKGGEITWKSSLSRSARPANTVREVVIEGDEVRIGEEANTPFSRRPNGTSSLT